MIELAQIFQNGMVLQRHMPIRIWGKTDEAQFIEVSINGKTVINIEIKVGDFEFYLPPQEAIESAKLVISGSAGGKNEFDNVDIGEVWIAGGQSNMEFCYKYDEEGFSNLSKANDSHIRFYDVGEFCFEGEREEGLKPDAVHWDRWMSFCPEDAAWFSATGYYFAQRIKEKLNVPIGIIGCNWGGTSASCWITEEDIRKDHQLKVYLDDYENAISKLNMHRYLKKDYDNRLRSSKMNAGISGDAYMRTECKKKPGFIPHVLMYFYDKIVKMGPHHPCRPCGLYYTMEQLIAGYSCKGVIWYQGESDEHHADLYSKLFTVLIHRWRKDWKQELPFLFVQLAPFEAWMMARGKNYPTIRAQQQKVEDNVSNVYMASIMDVGSRYDIHPKRKKPVGSRLAALALNNVYGHEDVPSRAPRIDNVEIKGNQIFVGFAFAERGLILEECDSQFAGLEYLFTVYNGEIEIPFRATIRNNCVILEVDVFNRKEELSISFADKDYCIVNLKSRDGLPARPCMRKAVTIISEAN